MKRALSLALAAVLIVFLIWFFFFRVGVSDVRNFPSSGSGIIAFGDSLIEGVGSSEGANFVSLLAAHIGEPIQNLGRAGETTAGALERLPAVLEEFPNPKVVIILFGGNDYLQKVPKEETFRRLGEIIAAFQNNGAIVLLIGIRGGIIKDNFKTEFENLSNTYRTAYVSNILAGLIGKNKYMFDSVHPNDSGYKKVADRVYPVLVKLVK